MITYDDLIEAAYLFLRCKEANFDDPLRPLYHLHAPANWMNDPHGAIYFNGKFHLFYQVNPYGKSSGYQSWGHFVSENLVRWKHAPLALVPEPPHWDSHGCWSGCCLLFDSGEGPKPTIFYTGAKYGSVHKDVLLEEQRQLTAVCIDDDLVRWQKTRDPVIEPSSHPDYRENGLPKILDCMRDPFVWQQGDRYYCLIGSAILKRTDPDELRGGNALIYQYDSGKWQLLSRRFCDIVLGRNWECCNLVRLDGKEIVIVSPEYKKESGGYLEKEKRHVIWISGSTKKDENGLLVPMGRDGEGSFYFKSDAKAQILDHGTYEGFYAATTFAHPDGRHIVWGWSTGGGEEDAEWNGVLSLPREISWKDYLSIAPLTEMERLRGEKLYERSDLGNEELANDRELERVCGDCLEIDAEVSIANYQEFLVRLWSGKVTISIEPEPFGGTLRITDARKPFETKLDPKLDWSCVRLHLFLDRSIIEVFLDDKQVITRRVAPWLAPNTRKDKEIAELLKNPRIEFRSRGGDISVRKLRIDRVNPVF